MGGEEGRTHASARARSAAELERDMVAAAEAEEEGMVAWVEARALSSPCRRRRRIPPLWLLSVLSSSSAQVLLPRNEVPKGCGLLKRLGDASVEGREAAKERRERFFVASGEDEEEGGQAEEVAAGSRGGRKKEKVEGSGESRPRGGGRAGGGA